LRSIEDLFGAGHLGFANSAGVRSFGHDVFDAGWPSASPPPSAGWSADYAGRRGCGPHPARSRRGAAPGDARV